MTKVKLSEVSVVALTANIEGRDIFDILRNLPSNLFSTSNNEYADLAVLSLQNSQRSSVLNFHSPGITDFKDYKKHPSLAIGNYNKILDIRIGKQSLIILELKSFQKQHVEGFIQINQNNANKLIHKVRKKISTWNYNNTHMNIDIVVDKKLTFNITTLNINKVKDIRKIYTKTINRNIENLLNSRFSIVMGSINSKLNIPPTHENIYMVNNRTYTFLKGYDSFYNQIIKDNIYLQFKEPFLYRQNISIYKELEDRFYCTNELILDIKNNLKCFNERILFYFPEEQKNKRFITDSYVTFNEYKTMEQSMLAKSHLVLKASFILKIPEIVIRKEMFEIEIIIFGLKRFGYYTVFLNKQFCQTVYINYTNQKVGIKCEVVYNNNYRSINIDITFGKQQKVVKNTLNILQKIHIVLNMNTNKIEYTAYVPGYDKGIKIYENWINLKSISEN